MNLTMIRWWAIFCSISFITLLVGLRGLLSKLWVVDQSHIATFTLFLFFFVSLFIGWLTNKLTTLGKKDEEYIHLRAFIQPCWFSSELFMGLGMVGTLIGFILMLTGGISSVDMSDVNASKQAIAGMAAGMGTAVLTTLIGVSASMLVKLQMSNLGIALERDDADEEEPA
jgi:hypothetical protein